MDNGRLAREALFSTLPPTAADSLLPLIAERIRRKVVVLDDDPTGTQTVHGVPVLTEHSVATLRAELDNDLPCFYILTNSRSLPVAEAQALNREIGAALATASAAARREFVVVSRSDSTLRGHFPQEVEALASALGGDFDAWLIIPFFEEGGRYTVGDVHYVAEGEVLVPAGETQYARDEAFGYRASDLRQWVAEKSGGRIPAERVVSISIEDIRQGPAQVRDRLLQIPRGGVAVVNAATYTDLERFVLGLLAAEEQGRRYLYRTAASFVRVRAGIAPRPLLTREELDLPDGGAGLFIVGSYVEKTTRQVNILRRLDGVCAVEVEVRRLLADEARADEIGRVAAAASAGLGRGEDTVIYTSREVVRGGAAERGLAIGRRISDSLIAILDQIDARPGYIVGKGGITSSDIATRGLGVRRAMVLGQILPGIPVWRLGAESRMPGLAYVVFPGNVGGSDALAAVARQLRAPAGQQQGDGSNARAHR